MPSSGITPVLLRFAAGISASLVVGSLAFGEGVLRPGSPAFRCLTVGAVVAAVFALFRSDRQLQGAAIGIVYGLTQLGNGLLRFPAVPVPAAIWLANGVTVGVALALLMATLISRGGIPAASR